MINGDNMEIYKLTAYIKDNKDYIKSGASNRTEKEVIHTYEYKFREETDVFMNSKSLNSFLNTVRDELHISHINLIWRLELVVNLGLVYNASVLFNENTLDYYIARGDLGNSMEYNHSKSASKIYVRPGSLSLDEKDALLPLFNIGEVRSFLNLTQWAILLRNKELILPYINKDKYSDDLFNNKYQFTLNEFGIFTNFLNKVGSNTNYASFKKDKEDFIYTGGYDDGFGDCQDGASQASGGFGAGYPMTQSDFDKAKMEGQDQYFNKS